MLASINGVDITKHILASTYDVNNEEIYNEWEDGYYIKHRDYLRDKVTGAFNLKFLKGTTDYVDFISLIEGAKRNGIIPMKVFVSNLNTEKTIDAYYSFRPVVRKNFADKVYDQFTFYLEER